MRTLLTLSLALLVCVTTSCSDQITAPDTVAAQKSAQVLAADGASAAKGDMKVLNFTAPLSTDEEPYEVVTDATGLAKFQYKDGVLTYKLIVANIENVRMAHIHLSPSGSVVVWLYPSAPPPQLIEGQTQGILAEGTITADNLTGPMAGQTLDDLLAAMAAGNTYVNVHTNQYPGGEIRGQIVHGNGVEQ